MLFLKKEDYYNLDLEYYLDFENPADCKFRVKVGSYEVFALNEGEVNNQIMVYTDDKFVGFVVDVPFDEVVEALKKR